MLQKTAAPFQLPGQCFIVSTTARGGIGWQHTPPANERVDLGGGGTPPSRASAFRPGGRRSTAALFRNVHWHNSPAPFAGAVLVTSAATVHGSHLALVVDGRPSTLDSTSRPYA